jgi:hypothetical protein
MFLQWNRTASTPSLMMQLSNNGSSTAFKSSVVVPTSFNKHVIRCRRYGASATSPSDAKSDFTNLEIRELLQRANDLMSRAAPSANASSEDFNRTDVREVLRICEPLSRLPRGHADFFAHTDRLLTAMDETILAQSLRLDDIARLLTSWARVKNAAGKLPRRLHMLASRRIEQTFPTNSQESDSKEAHYKDAIAPMAMSAAEVNALTDIIFGLAKLNISDHKLFSAVATICASNLDIIKTKQLTCAGWAFGTSSCKQAACFFDALVNTLKSESCRLSLLPRDYSTLAWAASRIQYANTELYELVANAFVASQVSSSVEEKSTKFSGKPRDAR